MAAIPFEQLVLVAKASKKTGDPAEVPALGATIVTVGLAPAKAENNKTAPIGCLISWWMRDAK